MNINIKLEFLPDPVPVCVASGCPVDAVRFYFHHILAHCGADEPSVMDLSPPSFRGDAFMRTIDSATEAILRRARADFEIMRGGAVVSKHGAVRLIVGRSGTGKTCRITKLIAQNWEYAGDDFLFFSRDLHNVYFLPICLFHRLPHGITLQVFPCRRTRATMLDIEQVEVLRPPCVTHIGSAPVEMFSLFLRPLGRPFPFEPCCDGLVPLTVWSTSELNRAHNNERKFHHASEEVSEASTP